MQKFINSLTKSNRSSVLGILAALALIAPSLLGVGGQAIPQLDPETGEVVRDDAGEIVYAPVPPLNFQTIVVALGLAGIGVVARDHGDSSPSE